MEIEGCKSLASSGGHKAVSQHNFNLLSDVIIL